MYRGPKLLSLHSAFTRFDNHVLSPKLTARTMALHPAVAFGAVIAGGLLYGAFLALPAAAILQAGLSVYLTRNEVVDSDLTREQPPSERTAKVASTATSR